MHAGIYTITNTLDGKVYVGASVNIRKRFTVHRNQLRHGTHGSSYLQRAWNKHGASAFELRPLLHCSSENFVLYEQRAVDSYRSKDRRFGYNHRPCVISNLGMKHSEETKAKITATTPRGSAHPYYGKRLSDAAYAAAAELKKQFGMSEKTKAKMSAAKKGVLKTDEHKNKIRLSNLGQVRSPETCARISLAKKGKTTGPRSIGCRAKMSQAHRGKPKSAEHRAALSKALSGKTLSLDHRNAISKGLRNRHVVNLPTL